MILIRLTVLVVCLFLISINAVCQVNLDIKPGYSFTNHELSEFSIEKPSFNAFQLGLSYMPKNIGLRFGYSFHEYSTNDNYISSLQEIGLINEGGDIFFKSNFISLGPVFQFGESKLKFQFSPDVKLGVIDSPDRIYNVPLGEEGTQVYADNNEESGLNGTSLFTGLNMNFDYQISKRVSFNIGGSVLSNRFLGDGNSIIYRQTDSFNQEELSNSPLIQLDCESHDIFNINTGITIHFGNNDNDDEPKEDYSEVLPPQPILPEHTSEISKAQADSLVLEWVEESPQVKYATYVIQLFKVVEENDSLMFADKVKKKKVLDLPDEVVFEIGEKYAWVVTATEHKELKNCLNECVSERFEFSVVSVVIPQYYEPLSNNSGNYVQAMDLLRFELSNSFLNGGEVTFHISEELNKNSESKRLLKEDSSVEEEFKGRFALNISELELNQYYTLIITNGKRTKYLRFIKATPNENSEQ
jgi:hypothetical protein